MKHPSSDPDARGGRDLARPSDLELMMWMDGELAAERAQEVAAFVAADARARDVIASLRTGAELLVAESERRISQHVPTTIADDVLDAAEEQASRRFNAPARRAPTWRTPAIAAGGFALALAASFFLVLRSVDRSRLPLAQGESTVSLTAPQLERGDDVADGAISVVDFGGRTGAVLYVQAEGKSTTAIVWLTDDAPAGESQ